MRGILVRSFTCPSVQQYASEATARVVSIGSVEQIALCAVYMLPSKPVAVDFRSAQFTLNLMIKALLRPSDRSSGMCPDYADTTYVALVRTSHGIYRVLFPTDRCGHYFPFPDAKAAQGPT
jgi:hypothetical protein